MAAAASNHVHASKPRAIILDPTRWDTNQLYSVQSFTTDMTQQWHLLLLPLVCICMNSKPLNTLDECSTVSLLVPVHVSCTCSRAVPLPFAQNISCHHQLLGLTRSAGSFLKRAPAVISYGSTISHVTPFPLPFQITICSVSSDWFHDASLPAPALSQGPHLYFLEQEEPMSYCTHLQVI